MPICPAEFANRPCGCYNFCMYRIFIVEDDGVIAAAMAKGLRSWGLDARCAEDFSNIIAEFEKEAPHLVLMDITLPFYNGYHWCAEIRKRSAVPIVFISSASDDMNIVMAMNMGGDDFIAKPFDMSVLSAKVMAMLRRSYDLSAVNAMPERGGAVLNVADASISFRGERAELTRNEYRILQVLMENAGRIVSREALMTRLWETDSYVDENALAVNMARLRKKLDALGLEDYITTRRGEGYMIP